jgi:hypothetical protein
MKARLESVGELSGHGHEQVFNHVGFIASRQ